MNKTLRVLIVEDSQDDALLMVRQLTQSGYEINYKRVDTAVAMEETLNKETWDIVLADYVMPGFSALSALELLQKKGIDIPFIVVSGKVGENAVAELMKTGANGFIMKNNLACLGRLADQEIHHAEKRRTQKKMEEALRESEKRYRELVENANSAIIRWKIDGTIVFLNEFAQRFFGYRAEEVIGKHISIIVPGQESTGRDLACMVRDIVRYPEKYINNLNENICRDGRRVWFTWTNKALYNEHGQLEQVLAVGSDITAYKDMEQLLKQSEEKYRALFDHVGDYLLVFELKPGEVPIIYEVNDTTLRMHGYTKEELLGKPVTLLDKDTSQDVFKEMARRLLNNEVIRFESRHHRKDGSTFEFEASVSSVKIGSKIFAVSIERDITQRKRMETALRASLDRYSALVENIELGVTLISKDYKVIMTNAFQGSLFRKPAAEFIGKDCFREFEKLDRPCAYCPGSVAMATGKAAVVDTQGVRDDGTKCDVRVRAFPVFGNDKETIGFIEVVEDVTESKAQEDALKASERKLQELFNHMSSCVAVYEARDNGADFVFIDINKAGEHYSKVKKEEIIGKSVLEVFPGIKEIGLFEVFRQVLKTGMPQQCPVMLYQDGRISHWVENHVYQLPSGEIVAIYEDVTERKRAEEALRISEKKFRDLFEGSTDGIVLIDFLTHKFHDANQSFCRMLGYTLDEIKALGAEDIHPPDALSYILEQIEKQAQNLVLPAVDLPVKRKDGSIFYANVLGTKMNLMGKDCNVGMFRDSTMRRKTEEALRQSEEKFRVLFESSRDAIMTLSPPSWKFVEANRATLEMFGAKTKEEFLSVEPWQVSPECQPDGRPSSEKARAMIETAMRDGTHSFEWVHKRFNGEEFSATVLLTRMKFFGQTLLEATVRDVTQEKQVQFNRKTSLEILELLNQQKDLNVTIRELLTMIKRVFNLDAVGMRLKKGSDYPYFYQIGFSDDFLQTENSLCSLGANGDPLCGEDGKPVLECTCGLVLSGYPPADNPLFTPKGSFWSSDTRPLLDLAAGQDPRLHPRNTCIHVGYNSVALIPLRSASETIGLLQLNARLPGKFNSVMLGFLEGLAVSIGITISKKRADEDLRIAFGRLKETQAQLVQSEKMASLGQLAGGVAHEINNPLTGVLNNVELIKEMVKQGKSFNDEEVRAFIDVIEESSLRCKNITKSLLNFSRASGGKLRMIALNELIVMTLTFLEQDFSLQNITITKEFQQDLPPIFGDQQLLSQVIYNMIVNAKWAIEKKSARAGGTVAIQTLYDGAARKVNLIISDTGCGIPKAILPHLFEPFFTTKEVGEGTGLGLSIAFSIVKAHAGTISVESEETKGTRFTITLPVADKEQRA